MLWKLVKIRLMGLFSQTFNRRKNNGKRRSPVLMIVLLAFCVLAFGLMFFELFGLMSTTIGAVPQYHWFYFAMVGIFAFGISFFFTAFTAKSELFEAKDNELLLAMPIRPRTILLSRMIVLLGTEYLFSFLVLIPAGLAWFLLIEMDALLLVRFIIGGLLLPLLSASIASLIGWLLARLTAKARNKTVVTMILSLVFLGIYFFVYLRAQTYIQLLLQNLESSASAVAVWGFLFKWFGDGIAYGELAKLAGVILISAAAYALAVLLISRGFLKISSASTVSHKKHTGSLHLQSRKVSSALLHRELKRFTSSAAYMLNCGLGLVLSLIAAVVLLIKAGNARELVQGLSEMGALTETELALTVAVALSFLASMDIPTAPSISLEGKNLWIIRSAPVSAQMILNAKLKFHELLCAPPTLVLSVSAAIVLHVGAAGWIALILVPQLFVLLSGTFGLCMNLRMPKLDWTNETVPIKQSASVTVTILVLMGYTMFAVIGFVLVAISGLLSAMTYLLIVVGIAAVWCAICLVWLRLRGAKTFETL